MLHGFIQDDIENTNRRSLRLRDEWSNRRLKETRSELSMEIVKREGWIWAKPRGSIDFQTLKIDGGGYFGTNGDHFEC